MRQRSRDGLCLPSSAFILSLERPPLRLLSFHTLSPVSLSWPRVVSDLIGSHPRPSHLHTANSPLCSTPPPHSSPPCGLPSIFVYLILSSVPPLFSICASCVLSVSPVLIPFPPRSFLFLISSFLHSFVSGCLFSCAVCSLCFQCHLSFVLFSSSPLLSCLSFVSLPSFSLFSRSSICFKTF